MTKTVVEIEQIKSCLIRMFDIRESPTADNASFVSEYKFNIDKRKFERLVVIDMLQTYFADKVVKGGYLQVGSITLAFTDFEIKKGRPE